MQEYEIASEMYSYFYRKYTKGAFGLSQNKTNISLVRKFLKRVRDEKMGGGVNWLFDYYTYQFHWMMQSNYSKVFPAFVFGDKAWVRYKKRNKKVHIFADREFLKSRNIVKSKVIMQILEDVVGADFKGHDWSDADETVKRNHRHNFVMCAMLTSLWHPISQECKTCSAAEMCKKHLSDKNSELYDQRIKMDLDGFNESVFTGTSQAKFK
jgi:hypothetical protein